MPALPRQRVAVLLTLAATLPLAQAQIGQSTQPDAGQTLRQLQQQPPRIAPQAKPGLVLPPEADLQADTAQRFAVQSIVIDGNVRLGAAPLQALVAPLAGRDSSLSELRQGAAAITAYYRTQGFAVARAYIPAQEIRDGVVRINIIEGSLTSTQVVNRSIVRDSVLSDVVAAQALQGKPVRTPELDRELLLLADLPAVGAVNGVLRPGRDVGNSDLTISADPGKQREGDVSLDNYGNRYTGQVRLNGHVELNSPAGIGDRLSLRATYTDEKLLYGRAVYDFPANGDGWRIGVNLSSSHYDLGREFAKLDADGTATTAGLQTSYPALRGLNANIWLRGAFDYRKLKDAIHATGTETRKSVRAGTAEAYGDLTDAVGGGAYSTWRLAAVIGKLDIDTAAALVADEAGPRANGGYHKLEYGATRLQALGARISAFLSLAGQVAQHNLDSSEKFVLGGMYGVRAYPQGEGVGDNAVLANLELRQDLRAGVQASVFYDYGHVKFNQGAYAAGPNTASLKGSGINLTLKYHVIDFKATLAWRNGQAAVSAPDRSPRLWLMAGSSF